MSKLFLAIASICALTVPMAAQVASAELSGSILDATGAAVANAKVRAINVGHESRASKPPAMLQEITSSRCCRPAITLSAWKLPDFASWSRADLRCRSISRRTSTDTAAWADVGSGGSNRAGAAAGIGIVFARARWSTKSW